MIKADRPPLAALMMLAFALWIPWMRGPIDLRWDAGVYYILGTSLAEGQGYRLLNEPGDPQAVQYPPLFPLFIAAQQRLLGTSDPVVVGTWLRWLNQLMLMACAALTYLLARRWVPRFLAFLAGVMFLLSMHTYFMGSLACPEVAFALVSLFFLVPGGSSRRGQIWSGLCAITAYLLRSIGIILLITWVGEATFRARWKAAIVRATVALLPVILWQGYVHRVESSQNYLHPAYAYQRAPYQFYNVSYSRNIAYVDPFKPELGRITGDQLVQRTVANLLLERRLFPETITTSLFFWGIIRSWIGPRVPMRLFKLFTSALSYFIMVLMIVGLASMMLAGEVHIPLYLTLSVLAIAATPWPAQFSRYFWPLSPLVAIAFMLGVIATRVWLASAGGRVWSRAGWALLSLLVAATISVEAAITVFNWVRSDFKQATYVNSHNVVHTYHLIHYYQRWQNFDRAVDWIKREAGPNAVVATECPQYVYLRSGRKAVMPPVENDPAKAALLLDTVPVTYLVVDDFGLMGDVVRSIDLNVMRRYPTQWKIVAITPDAKIVVYRHVRNEPGVYSPNASSSVPR
jgi:hypothetical protein